MCEKKGEDRRDEEEEREEGKEGKRGEEVKLFSHNAREEKEQEGKRIRRRG